MDRMREQELAWLRTIAGELATQTIALSRAKVRRINVDGRLGPGVYAKDVILHITAQLGAKGGIGYAY